MIAEQRDQRPASAVLFVCVEPANLRRDAEDAQVIRGDGVADQQLRRALTGERVLVVIRRREVFKDAAALPGSEVAGAAGVRLSVACIVRSPHRHDAIGVLVGKRVQHDGLDDGKDGGGCAHAERECQDRGHSESRRLAKLMQRELYIGPDAFEREPLPDLAAAFSDNGRVAELAVRSLGGFLPCHPLFHQLIGTLLDMLANRKIQIVIAAVT